MAKLSSISCCIQQPYYCNNNTTSNNNHHSAALTIIHHKSYYSSSSTLIQKTSKTTTNNSSNNYSTTINNNTKDNHSNNNTNTAMRTKRKSFSSQLSPATTQNKNKSFTNNYNLNYDNTSITPITNNEEKQHDFNESKLHPFVLNSSHLVKEGDTVLIHIPEEMQILGIIDPIYHNKLAKVISFKKDEEMMTIQLLSNKNNSNKQYKRRHTSPHASTLTSNLKPFRLLRKSLLKEDSTTTDYIDFQIPNNNYHNDDDENIISIPHYFICINCILFKQRKEN
ncbi:hypothetical protein ABK040_001410 [Willaertia magna]